VTFAGNGVKFLPVCDYFLFIIFLYFPPMQSCPEIDVEGTLVPQPPRLHLSAEKLDSHGAFLMDVGDYMMMYVGHSISSQFCTAVLGVPSFSHIPEEMVRLLTIYIQLWILG
jgi:protein transport protein SEC24